MALHWIMALLIFILLLLGWWMEDLPKGSDERSYFFALHKSIGLTTFALLVLRLAWRVFNTPPGLPITLRTWQRQLAIIIHHSLYVLMIVQPLTGYLSSSFSGYKTKIWGVIILPQWADKNKELNAMFSEFHEICSILLSICILIHLAGAFAYMFSKHENVLLRMMPWKK